MIGVYPLGTQALGTLALEDSLGSKEPYAGVFSPPGRVLDIFVEIEILPPAEDEA